MPLSRTLPAVAAVAALISVSGCASWSDRWSMPYGPVMYWLGAEPPSTFYWPGTPVPDLPALSTQQLPDRLPPPADPPIGWPPLAPAIDAPTADRDASACNERCNAPSPRATTSDPDLARRSEHVPIR